MRLSDFHYDLPSELIASFPLKKRSESRLLCLDRGIITHKHFTDITSLISEKDLLVLNNTKVIAARLLGHKESGGRVEILIERILDKHRVLAHVRASKSPQEMSILFFPNNIRFKVLGRQEALFELVYCGEESILDVVESYGEIPLPPYFNRAPTTEDKERYQTIFAEHKGSVAAPTAGLHFDENLLATLQEKKIEIAFITLHVGAGTFSPVRREDISQHKMHAEFCHVSETLCEKIKKTKARGGRIIAVGTTTARSLESASQNGEIKPFRGDTDIFIYPGYSFRCVDALITNFHLPGSTLLMLVSALAGRSNIMHAYQEAIKEKYRFFSYGDAMFIC